jgi:hypothetical protein
VLRKNVVTLFSLQACIHGANQQELDTPPLVGALECGAGVVV